MGDTLRAASEPAPERSRAWGGEDRGNAYRGSVIAEKLLTSAEIAELLGFSAGTIVDWAERGTIPAFKIGGRLRFRESEVVDWMESRRLKAGAGGEAPTTPQRPQGVVSVMPTTPLLGGEDAS